MSKIRTHYDNLKIARNAPDIVIKAAHKALMQIHHPDKATDKVAAERITRILNDARDVLLDPVRRRQHDDWIREQEAKHHPHAHTSHHNRPPHHNSHHHDSAQASAKAEPPPEKPHQDTERRVGKYKISSNGTAFDSETQLLWCRFALGQIWHNHEVLGEAKVFNWEAAKQAADDFNQKGGFAGYTDWRLPSLSELKTLLDRLPETARAQFINAQVFPDNPQWLWTSTPYAGYGGGAWFVNFTEGLAVNESPDFHRSVRLVRG